MGHIHIRHLVAASPRVARMRREERDVSPVRPSRQNELWYRVELGRIVALLKTAGAEAVADLRAFWPIRPRFATDATPPSVRAAIERAARRFGDIEVTARRIAGAAAQRNLQEVDDRLARSIQQAVSVNVKPYLTNVSGVADRFREMRDANVALIKTVPQRYFARLADVITEAWEGGTRWEDVADLVTKVGKAGDYNAWRIARDQTSKMNAAFNEIRQTELGIEEYDWSGVGDVRERDSHRAMEGVRCRWDRPPVVDGQAVHPGQAILCRCVSRPVINIRTLRLPERALREAA